MSNANKHRAEAVSWACASLAARGIEFHSVGGRKADAWDILTPSGWIGVNTWQELCAVTREILRANA